MGNSQGKPVEFDGEGAYHSIRPLLPICFGPWPTRSRIVSARSTDTFSLYPTVNLNHFRLLRVVGRGAFGKVRIVERKDTNLSFALKYIRKDEGAQTDPQASEICSRHGS